MKMEEENNQNKEFRGKKTTIQTHTCCIYTQKPQRERRHSYFLVTLLRTPIHSIHDGLLDIMNILHERTRTHTE